VRFASRRFFSTALGGLAGLLTLVVALAYLVRWSQHETLRTLVSQVGFFSGVALFGALGIVEFAFALRPGGAVRAAVMTTLGAALLIDGAIASGALDETGAWLFYVGLIAITGAAFAIAEARRRVVPAIAGLLGAIALLAFIYGGSRIVLQVFH
jgi:hypothetical protein